MGRVYRAEQTALGRTVAVKIVHPYLSGDENASARFISEARTASRLNHPNSVSVIDFGKTEGGQLYLVMEYLRGRDLARVVFDDGLLSFHRIIDVLRQVLAALAEAHHIGIIHRDLKPENIVIEPMRSGGDFVKVVDFGLAKMLDKRDGPSITSAGIVCGTPDYMAPEQGRGDAIDARADLYAVGVILYQLLTGRLPFEAENPTQVVLMHLTVPPKDPRQVAPERNIPVALAIVTQTALSKDPKDRYQDADAFAAALATARAQLETTTSDRVSSLPDDGFTQCPSCAAQIPRNQRFCGDCGARVPTSSRPSEPTVPQGRTRLADVRPIDVRNSKGAHLDLPLTSRDDDIAWLMDRHAETVSRLHAARIVADAGMGKSRIINEFIGLAKTEGDIIAQAGPDPWWAEVAFHTIRSLIIQLANLPRDGGIPEDWTGAGLDAHNGLGCIFGLPGIAIPADASRRCVSSALRWAIMFASARAGHNKVIVVVDDLNRVDGPSRNAISDLVGESISTPTLVVATHVPGFDAHWPGNTPARILSGFTPDTAASMVRGANLGQAFAEMGSRGVPPLYVEQLARFTYEGGTAPPSRLADIIALRIARLDANARRVLQALAVLGDGVMAEFVAGLVEKDTPITSSLNALIDAGMVMQTGSTLAITHSLVREIAQVSIPAGVRRELHAAALNLSVELGLPVESRAIHAIQAQDAFEALLLLEQIGDASLGRDDILGAVDSFRRGLDCARREIFRGELDDPMRAVLIFSRKLGEALTRAGALTDADGVLREALDLAPPSGIDRAKVLLALARVARARQRTPDAFRLLREAIDIANRSGEHDFVTSMEETGRNWAK
jgi:serine/threonine-protein kinase